MLFLRDHAWPSGAGETLCPPGNPRYSAEETARRGDALYERDIRAQVEPTHHGKVVAIDTGSGAYVIDDNALTASESLLAQHPDAEIWCVHPYDRTVTTWVRLPDGAYQETRYREGSVRPVALPNVTVALADLFAP